MQALAVFQASLTHCSSVLPIANTKIFTEKSFVFATILLILLDKNSDNARRIKQFIERALHEDVRDDDHTSLACIPADAIGKAHL